MNVSCVPKNRIFIFRLFFFSYTKTRNLSLLIIRKESIMSYLGQSLLQSYILKRFCQKDLVNYHKCTCKSNLTAYQMHSCMLLNHAYMSCLLKKSHQLGRVKPKHILLFLPAKFSAKQCQKNMFTYKDNFLSTLKAYIYINKFKTPFQNDTF